MSPSSHGRMKRVSSNRIALKRVSSNRIALKRVSSNRIALRRVPSNRIALKRVSPNRIALKRVSSNRIALKRVSSNRIALKVDVLQDRGKKNSLQVRACIFQPGNFTYWGNERDKGTSLLKTRFVYLAKDVKDSRHFSVPVDVTSILEHEFSFLSAPVTQHGD